jgi:hypothetical protein
MFTMYRRGWHKIYPVILQLLKACQKTWCVGHRTTHTNRRWGDRSAQGGFGWLARTLLPYVGHVSHTGLAHKEDHPNAHLGAAPYMRARWRQWRHCYRLRPRGMMPWSSACDNLRLCSPPWEYHMWAWVLSSLHLQTVVVHRLLAMHMQVWLILCKLLIFNQCYGLDMHIIKILNCFHYL